MNKCFSAVLLLAIGFAACKGSNKVTTTSSLTAGARSSECEKVLSGSVPHLSWYKEKDEVLKNSPNPIMLPKEHSLYSIDTGQARVFFMVGKDGAVETALPLPAPIGCMVFSFKNSGTMSEELQAKYPDIVSLKGTSAANKKGDARLDYNGKSVQGQVILNDEVYMITSTMADNRYYYVVYKKAVMENKQHIEERPAEIIKLRVDK